MVRRNQPRGARPRHLGDRALRDWLLQRRAEGWEGLDDEEDVEDEDFVGDEVAVEGEAVVENAANEEAGIEDGDFAGGDWEDDNVVPLDLLEAVQQQAAEQAAALAEELPPRIELQWPAESAGEAELCPICQERVGQNGRAVACPFCDVAFCFRCARDLLDSGRPGELDEQGYPVRDQAGWLAHPQHPAENLAFRDVFAGYRPLRLGVARLRAENERLQEQAQAAEELRAQNERLRAEVAALSRQLGGLVVEDDGEEQVGPPVAAGALPSEQVAEAAVPAVAGAVEAPVVARRGGPINDGQQPGPSGLVAPGQVGVRRGGPIEDGQRPGPSGVVALPLATGRRRVPSRFRDASGVFVCPECGYRTPHRGHADDHFSRHAGSDVHAAWTMEQQERRGRPVGGGGPHRRQRRRHRVRGTMAFEFEEEEEIEYED